MRKLKLVTIVGTRPEIIKLSEIIKKCDNYFDHILIHTGQNYDYNLNQVFFNELSIRKPDYFLNVVGDSLGETIGNIISKSYTTLVEVNPDAILVLGDTNSCLSVIAAKRLKIPIFHLEAGNRCFDENLPEEVNRKIVDHTSDVNLCYTEHARRNLFSEGVSIDRTFVVGSPMKEIITKHLCKINGSMILSELNLEKQNYIVVSAHREENIDIHINFQQLMQSLNAIAEKYNIPIIYSLHPRSKKKIDRCNFELNKNIILSHPFGFFDYMNLQKNALCVVSDSGTLAEEASYFKFPAVSIRTSTERPEALEKGNFIIGGIDQQNVLNAVEMAIEMFRKNDLGADVLDYDDIEMSKKVINIIQSYTSIINKIVWRKNE